MAKDMFEYKDTLSRQDDYTQEIIKASNYNLVLLKHLKNSHKDAVAAYERQTEFESDVAPGIIRVAEGTNKSDTFKAYTNDLVTSVLEESYSLGYKVTKQSIKLKGMRLMRDLVADARMKDLDAMMLGIEAIVGSNQECVQKASTSTVTMTRGLMNWLQPTAHSVCAFNERHLPAGEIVLAASGDDAILSEEAFKAMLKAARIKSKRALNLYGFAGPELLSQFVDFLIMVQPNKNITRNIDYTKTEIFQNVDFLSYEGNNVTLVGLDTLARDPSTFEKTAVSDYAGAFIEVDKFDLEWLEQPHHVDTSPQRDLGSGPEGYHNAQYRLGSRCLVSGFRITKELS